METEALLIDVGWLRRTGRADEWRLEFRHRADLEARRDAVAKGRS